jgi:hypothetical protein
MDRKINTPNSDELLDRLGQELTRARVASEEEIEAAATSPFLFTRVRACVAAERERREAGDGWLALFAIFRRSVPAMALVAALTFALFLFALLGTSQNPVSNSPEDAFLDSDSTVVENVVFAESRQLSNDEVLTRVLNGGEGEASR